MFRICDGLAVCSYIKILLVRCICQVYSLHWQTAQSSLNLVAYIVCVYVCVCGQLQYVMHKINAIIFLCVESVFAQGKKPQRRKWSAHRSVAIYSCNMRVSCIMLGYAFNCEYVYIQCSL